MVLLAIDHFLARCLWQKDVIRVDAKCQTYIAYNDFFPVQSKLLKDGILLCLQKCIFQLPSDKLEAAFGSNYLLEIYLTVVLFCMYGFLSQENLYKFRPSKFCILCLPSIKKLPLQEFSSNAMVQLFCQTTDESSAMEYLMFYWLSSYFKKHHLINA